MSSSRSASRRLLLWFVVATVPATLALAWLGWVVTQQDRVQSRNRNDAEREQAADVGVAALARTLTELEASLGSTRTVLSDGHPDSLSLRTPILTFDAQGVVSRGGLLLPYCPAVSRSVVTLPDSFTLADDFEFVRDDARGAIRVVLPFSRDERPAVRAEAWLRLARNYRKVGEIDRALEAFRALSLLGDAVVQGLPAGLMGRNGPALIFSAAKHDKELQQEASGLLDDLTAGRWRLTEAQFEHSLSQMAEWLGRDVADVRPRIDRDRQVLLSAAEILWREGIRADRLKPRRTITVNDASVLVLARPVPQGVAVRLVSAAVLQEAWRANLPPAARVLDFVLTDPEGHDVIGTAARDRSRVAVRTTAASGLPWTLTAADSTAADPVRLSSGARLMLGGVALMLLVVVVSGYAIVRAVSREMRVARLQADFVAAVSHEFRTPLTTIRQLSEMLVHARVGSSERRQQFYEAILGESQRLHRLVEGLLDFGRMEAGQLQYKLESLDLGSLVRDVAASVAREAAPTGYRIEVDQAEPVPAVRADRDALGYAIRNLLDNAVKYSPDHKTIQVSLSNGDGRVAIRVRDRGLGIPAAEQREIFEKFVRGTRSASRNIAGTGVGLAMARQIVEAHHGTISVESTPGEGSTFTIHLPAEQAARP